ncbi:hypothetical protein AB0J38_27970 [Streptomyces sp. NPDC050095]|uniref:hypothetical protein n=1 Tax=unclassified Streptomyces TaxID=2593676 RepID=UPI00344823DE
MGDVDGVRERAAEGLPARPGQGCGEGVLLAEDGLVGGERELQGGWAGSRCAR